MPIFIILTAFSSVLGSRNTRKTSERKQEYVGKNSKTSDEELFQSIWPTTQETSENVRENVLNCSCLIGLLIHLHTRSLLEIKMEV